MSGTFAHREINPYEPPQAATWVQWPLLPPERWSEVQLRVDHVVPGTMERRIWISGTTVAEIRYYQSARDTVEVNGEARGRGSLWDASIVTPTIEFWLDGDGYRIPARVDAVAGLSWLTLFRLTKFRLTVAGQVIYEEGHR
ncbi:MAG: hypothetical protein L0211_08330 [Planctomycetaceae bacterium]|nr:hypothetical protein [Planctomycetaceae bacterium]